MNINRLIYPGFWFGKTDVKDALELARRGVGGFCIYKGTLPTVRELVQQLRKASPLPHLFICADYEDGLGKWIPGTPWVLSNLAVGATQSEDAAYQKGLTLAREARSVGVDWVYAPVLDLCDEPQNPIVNTRSFGKDPQAVARLGKALCRGLKDGGVLNSIKHFPGHGRTTQDSHLGLPVLQRSAEQLKTNELIPFREVLPTADSVMIGHLLLPALDKQHPASLSENIITGLLKKQLGYPGLVLTDALCMKAIGDEKQAALQALHAGAHILLAAENSIALSDFLQKQHGLEQFVETSVALQDELIQRLHAPHKAGLSAVTFNKHFVAQSVVYQGKTFTLKPGQEISYLELGNEERFAAQTFLRALKKQGIIVKKYDGSRSKILVAVSFSNFKAFKGHINLSAEEKQLLTYAAQNSQKSIFVSFGSPFGSQKIDALSARLFCFGPSKEAQRCAAAVLTGQIKPTGQMPV